MIDMIRAMYNGKADPVELRLKKRSKYRTITAKIEQVVRSLESDTNRDAVKELESLMIEAEDESSYAYFAVGFRWGARMMLSILTEGDTALMTEEENDNA